MAYSRIVLTSQSILLSDNTAINTQDLAGDPVCFVRRQESRRRRDIFRLAKTTCVNAVYDFQPGHLAHRLPIVVRLLHSDKMNRRNRIHGYTMLTKLKTELLGQSDQGVFGCCIGVNACQAWSRPAPS